MKLCEWSYSDPTQEILPSSSSHGFIFQATEIGQTTALQGQPAFSQPVQLACYDWRIQYTQTPKRSQKTNHCRVPWWWWTSPICFLKPAHIPGGFVCQRWQLGPASFHCACPMPLITIQALEAHCLPGWAGTRQRPGSSWEEIMGLVYQLFRIWKPHVFHTQLAYHSFGQK